MNIPPKNSANLSAFSSGKEIRKSPSRVISPVAETDTEKYSSDERSRDQFVDNNSEKRKAEKSPSRSPPPDGSPNESILAKSAIAISAHLKRHKSVGPSADVAPISGGTLPRNYDIKLNWNAQEIRRLWAGPNIVLIARPASAAVNPSSVFSIKLIINRGRP